MSLTESWFVLGELDPRQENSFIRAGVSMIIDGAEPDLILDLLETWRDTMLRQHEMSMDMIIAGLLAVSADDNPLMVQLREQAWYRTELEIDVDDSMDVPRLKQQLKKRPHAHMSLDERATCMAQLSAIARREDILHLRKLLGHLGDEFLKTGVRLLVNGAEPHVAMEVLGTRKETVMDRHRTRCRMAY